MTSAPADRMLLKRLRTALHGARAAVGGQDFPPLCTDRGDRELQAPALPRARDVVVGRAVGGHLRTAAARATGVSAPAMTPGT